MLAHVAARTDEAILAGTLHCPDCQHEYPIIDGVPVIVPELRRLLSERGLEMLLGDDLDPSLASILGDAIGPDSWLDVIRQTQSTYMWDGYADLDPPEIPGTPIPGAGAAFLHALLDGPSPHAIPGLSRLAEQAEFPWQHGCMTAAPCIIGRI